MLTLCSTPFCRLATSSRTMRIDHIMDCHPCTARSSIISFNPLEDGCRQAARAAAYARVWKQLEVVQHLVLEVRPYTRGRMRRLTDAARAIFMPLVAQAPQCCQRPALIGRFQSITEVPQPACDMTAK